MEYTPDSNYCFYTDSNGDVFATSRGLNRLVSKTHFYSFTRVRSRMIKDALSSGTIKAVVRTKTGLQDIDLYNEEQIKAIIIYYALQGNPQALVTLGVLLGVGARVFIRDETNTSSST